MIDSKNRIALRSRGCHAWRKPRPTRPMLEGLEDRRLLADSFVSVSGNFGVTSYAGVGFERGAVAYINGTRDGVPDTNIGDYHAQIDWGDGTGRGTGEVVLDQSANRLYVKGSHIYAAPRSTYPVKVYVTGPDGTTANAQTARANVVDARDNRSRPLGRPTSYRTGQAEDVFVSTSGNFGVTSYAGVGFERKAVAYINGSRDGVIDTDVGDYHAQIDWGDGTGWRAGEVVLDRSANRLYVKGTHVYAAPNSDYRVRVYVSGPDGTSASAETASANVSEARDNRSRPLGLPKPYRIGQAEDVFVSTSGNFGVTSYAGVGFERKAVAHINGSRDGVIDTDVGDYHAQIDWGDGTGWRAGEVVLDRSANRLYVKGSHIYAAPGTNYRIRVYISGPDGTTASAETARASVSDARDNRSRPLVRPTSYRTGRAQDVFVSTSGNFGITSIAGAGFEGKAVAYINGTLDGSPDVKAGHYHAQINWGDGTGWNAGEVVLDPTARRLYVRGSHIYAAVGTNYHIKVYVSALDGTSASAETSRANVQAPPLPRLRGTIRLSDIAGGLHAGVPIRGVVATLGAAATLGLRARISWGDGSASDGRIVPAGSNTLNVNGTHTYARPGTYRITVVATNATGQGDPLREDVTIQPRPVRGTSAANPFPGGTREHPFPWFLRGGREYAIIPAPSDKPGPPGVYPVLRALAANADPNAPREGTVDVTLQTGLDIALAIDGAGIIARGGIFALRSLVGVFEQIPTLFRGFFTRTIIRGGIGVVGDAFEAQVARTLIKQGESLIPSKVIRVPKDPSQVPAFSNNGFDLGSYSGFGRNAQLYINETKDVAGKVYDFSAVGLGKRGQSTLPTFRRNLAELRKHINDTVADPLTRETLLKQLDEGKAILRFYGKRSTSGRAGTFYDPERLKWIADMTGLRILPPILLP